MARTQALRSSRLWFTALLLFAVTALLLPALSEAKGHGKGKPHGRSGAVYTETNAPSNEVVVFNRRANGSISEVQRVSTDGAGANGNDPFGQGFLDSNGAVELTKNGRLLFVVNAGDGTISSFRVGHKGKVTLVDRKPSGDSNPSSEDHPTSIDSHKGLLYVLNLHRSDHRNEISGLRYSRKGKMTPIPSSTQPLPTAGGTTNDGFPTPFADQVLFSPSGRAVIVPERLSNGYMGQLDVFPIGSDGRAGPAQGNASNAFIPFGLEFDRNGHLIVANGGPPPMFSPGSGSSYAFSGTTLTPIDNKLAGDDATCWLAITNSGKYAFMINQPPGKNGSVSRFKIGGDGSLTLLGTVPTTGAPADTALSRNSRYLYVQNIVLPGGTGGATIDRYKVGNQGGLTYLDTTDSGVPGSASGLAAR